ncbi:MULTISPECIES: hypothetical protein [unclassified Paenibacillus]|uniref:hypothetical protein n=1 Tax=unclassified Paenibacillus TaxID=185978 RepID=UPI00363BB17C
MHKNREITELVVPLSLCFMGFPRDKGTTLPLLSFASRMLRGVRRSPCIVTEQALECCMVRNGTDISVILSAAPNLRP